MKSLSYYILLVFLLIATYGCKEDDHPYTGYIVIDRAVVEATGGTTTVTADTDISAPILLNVDEGGADWCTVSVSGKQITVTATQANPNPEEFRTTTVNVRCGSRVTKFTVLQKYEGQEFLQFDWDTWEAIGSDVQESDGGGYKSLFTEDRTTFWHSQYSPALENPLPHWITIDMKKELPIEMIRIGRRLYAPSSANYATVKTMEIHTSIDGDNFTKVSGFTFALPWTAPDGTVVTGATHALIPPYEEIILPEITNARYVKLVITETNNTTGACQVSYFKAYEKL